MPILATGRIGCFGSEDLLLPARVQANYRSYCKFFAQVTSKAKIVRCHATLPLQRARVLLEAVEPGNRVPVSG